MSNRVKSPAEVRHQLERLQSLAQDIINGLNGKGFRWGDGEHSTWVPIAERRLGVTLVTATGAKKRGYRLKAGAKPIGEAYYGAPLQIYADLYVLECQCVPLATPLSVPQSDTEEAIDGR